VSKKRVHITLPVESCDLIFFGLGEVGLFWCMPAIFLQIRNGETLPHHPPEYAEEMHNPQYGNAAVSQQH
jgi:hypothetical protein